MKYFIYIICIIVALSMVFIILPTNYDFNHDGKISAVDALFAIENGESDKIINSILYKSTH